MVDDDADGRTPGDGNTISSHCETHGLGELKIK